MFGLSSVKCLGIPPLLDSMSLQQDFPHCLTRTQAVGCNPGVANNVPSFVGAETLETNPRVPKLLHSAERYQAFSIPHVLEGHGPVLFKILRVFNIVDFCGASGREVEMIERTEASVSQLGEQK